MKREKNKKSIVQKSAPGCKFSLSLSLSLSLPSSLSLSYTHKVNRGTCDALICVRHTFSLFSLVRVSHPFLPSQSSFLALDHTHIRSPFMQSVDAKVTAIAFHPFKKYHHSSQIHWLCPKWFICETDSNFEPLTVCVGDEREEKKVPFNFTQAEAFVFTYVAQSLERTLATYFDLYNEHYHCQHRNLQHPTSLRSLFFSLQRSSCYEWWQWLLPHSMCIAMLVAVIPPREAF